MYTYSQRDGKLYRDGHLIGVGYAGHPPHVNDTSAQFIHDVGPLPCGFYTIGPAYNHVPPQYPKNLGPVCMNLTPDLANDMRGRGDFRIHGDSPDHIGSSSDGCIVLPRITRIIVDNCQEDKRLQVVPDYII